MAPRPGLGVLLVEDDRELRGVLSTNLEREGFDVFQAVDGGEAIRVLDENSSKITVVLTDLGIPVIGGVDLIEEIKRRRADVRIVCISGFDNAEVRAAVLKAGADRFVPKPFRLESIVAVLSSVVAHQ